MAFAVLFHGEAVPSSREGGVAKHADMGESSHEHACINACAGGNAGDGGGGISARVGLYFARSMRGCKYKSSGIQLGVARRFRPDARKPGRPVHLHPFRPPWNTLTHGTLPNEGSWSAGLDSFRAHGFSIKLAASGCLK